MHRWIWLGVGLGALGLVCQGRAAIAGAPPLPIAQVETTDSRSPVGTVDPDQPIQLEIVNVSRLDAAIGAVLVQPPSDERLAAPGETVTFGRLHTSFLPPPLELDIFASDPEVSLDGVTILVRDNRITVTVAAQAGVAGSTRSVRVNAAGEVFLD
ncbi:MAG TPA: hypothetical protein VLS96_14185 [Nodosilinea sp.]|nr:hypothetical protein [Nodosilinea sp.]